MLFTQTISTLVRVKQPYTVDGTLRFKQLKCTTLEDVKTDSNHPLWVYHVLLHELPVTEHFSSPGIYESVSQTSARRHFLNVDFDCP